MFSVDLHIQDFSRRLIYIFSCDYFIKLHLAKYSVFLVIWATKLALILSSFGRGDGSGWERIVLVQNFNKMVQFLSSKSKQIPIIELLLLIMRPYIVTRRFIFPVHI